MRPRTLRRRGQFYRRRRSHWRLNLTLAVIGVALAGFVVVTMWAGPPPGPAQDAAKAITGPTAQAPMQAASAVIGPTTLAAAASAPAAAPSLRLGRPSPLVAGSARGANRRGDDSDGARLGAPTVHDADLTERPTAPAPLAQRAPAPPDEVPF